MQIKNICRQAEKSDYIILMSMLSCIILTGGFFWYSCIIPCVLLLVYIFVKHGGFVTWQSIAFLVMVGIGIISAVFSKGDTQNGFYEFEKLLCLILSIYAGSKCENKNTLKTFIVVSAAFISIAGLCAYCNIIRISEFVLFDRNMIRLQSFIKYSNTTSILLACGYFLMLADEHKSGLWRCTSQCVVLALYLTISKGGIILYLLVGIVFVSLGRKNLKTFVIQNALNIAFCILIVLAVSRHLYALAFILVAINIAVGQYVLKLNINPKTFKIMLICGLAIGGIATAILINLVNIDLFTTFEKRLCYMRDACKLLKNHLLFGIGSGAWKDYQFTIQTQSYDVRYIHNGWLQFLVENGIVFTLMLLAVMIRSIMSLIKQKELPLLSCAVLIVLHSLMDFDLSFGITLIIFGLILGLGIKHNMQKHIFKIANSILIFIIVLIIAYMCSEFFIRSCFEKNCVNENYDKALNTAYILEKICPYDSNLQISIAALDENNAKEHIKKARNLSPCDANILKQYIDYYISNHFIDSESIFNLIKEYIELRPKQETTYTDAYEFLNRIWEQKKCSQEEYNAMSEYIERRQYDEQVINRNQLLYDN